MIAGGMFGLDGNLDSHQMCEPQFMSGSRLLFLNARCALRFLLDKLNPPQVWIPSYLCCSVLEAVDQTAIRLEYFPIGSNLEIISMDWLEQLLPGSLVILIDYFGFPCDKRVITKVQERGGLVLEDASQALLSTHVGFQSDFVLFSPRKIVGVPDGGILRFKKDNAHLFSSVKLLPPPSEWWLKALDACIARREFDKFGGEKKWYELFTQVEASYPLGLYRMSELSEFLLKMAFNFQSIADSRRANYSYLLGRLSDYALLKELDQNTVPLGFPVRIHQRDKIRHILFDQQIYSPVHWEIEECVPTSYVASHMLSKSMITIPCDHRLKKEDMVHIADNFLKAMIRK